MRNLVCLLVASALVLSGCCCRAPCGRPVCCPPAAVVEASPGNPPSALIARSDESSTAADRDAATLERLWAKRLKDLAWEDTDFKTAVVYLRTITGEEFVLTPAALQRDEGVQITLALPDIGVGSLLDMLTARHDLTWGVKNGVVTIDARAPDALARLRYFDVKDLVNGVTTDARLLRVVRAAAPPGTWNENTHLTQMRNGILIVRASPDTLDAIGERLDAIRLKVRKAPIVVQIHSVDDIATRFAELTEAAEETPHLGDAAHLVEALRAYVRPAYWVEDPRSALDAQGRSSIVVRAESEVQDVVDTFLSLLREGFLRDDWEARIYAVGPAIDAIPAEGVQPTVELVGPEGATPGMLTPLRIVTSAIEGDALGPAVVRSGDARVLPVGARAVVVFASPDIQGRVAAWNESGADKIGVLFEGE